jgi:Mg2+ and Co2+ transporter CorA
MGKWSLTIDERFWVGKDLMKYREMIEKKIRALNKLVDRIKELEKKVYKESIEEMQKKISKLEEDICDLYRDCLACPIKCERYIKGFEAYCNVYNCRFCPHLRICVSPNLNLKMRSVIGDSHGQKGAKKGNQ